MSCVYRIIFYDDKHNIVDQIYISSLDCMINEVISRIYMFPRFYEISIIYNGDKYE